MSEEEAQKLADTPKNENEVAVVPSDSKEGGAALKQELSLLNGITIIVGSVIGSGIFVSPTGVSRRVGSVALSLMVWVVMGFYSMVGAYCFAELGTLIPKSGGDYVYIMECFGKFFSFLRLWVEVMVIDPGTLSAIALTFAKYVVFPFFPDCKEPKSINVLLAILCIWLIAFVNCASVKWAKRVQDVFTFGKTAALLLIIVTGFYALFTGETQNFEDPFGGSTSNIGDITNACYQGLFAYNGWNYLNVVLEEMKSPEKNLPRAVWISLSLVTFIYTFTNIAYFTTIPIEQLVLSEAVGVVFALKWYGVMWWIIPVFVSLSCFGTVNGTLFMSSRLFFVGGRHGQLPEIVNTVTLRSTPAVAVMCEAILATIYLLTGSGIYQLISFTGFAVWLAIGFSIIALLIFRKTKADVPRTVKVWLGFPIMYIIGTGWLVGTAIIGAPTETLFGLLIICTGIPVYLVCIVWENKPKTFLRVMTTITGTVQKLLLSVHESSDSGQKKTD